MSVAHSGVRLRFNRQGLRSPCVPAPRERSLIRASLSELRLFAGEWSRSQHGLFVFRWQLAGSCVCHAAEGGREGRREGGGAGWRESGLLFIVVVPFPSSPPPPSTPPPPSCTCIYPVSRQIQVVLSKEG